MSSTSASISESTEQKPSTFRIVGIGASAGGLESLEQFFTNLPQNPGMAFVVIQHLSPDFRSMMDELLARHSDMPVRVAEHGVEVQPNHVYLLPPRKEMTIRERHLLLTDKERAPALTLPIDLFFRSLAQDAGPDAVAIVLSGSGSDGSRGVRDIKRSGGLVLVESPDSAKFDGMPLSALATGVVDHSASASDIPLYLNEEFVAAVPAEQEPLPDESPMESVLRLLRDQFGLDFSLYKTTTVTRRVQRRVELMGLPDIDAYADRLRMDPDELGLLYHDLLIGVTRFFRDPEAFDVLERVVVPEILERVPESEEIRVWVAACATGEEAYSLAMILFEQLSTANRPVNVKILSTDVHVSSLSHASAGFYGEEQLEHVNERRRERFFTKKPSGYQISQDLRQLIVFAPHNVTKDAPFTKMHLISCRNLLIYLEPPAQKTVLSLFHFGLSLNGILFLGSSESPGALAHEFVAIDEKWKVYRKCRDVRLLEPLKIPLSRKAPGTPPSFLGSARSPIADTHLLGTYDQLLDRHMPPSFLVDEDRHLLDSFGGAEKLFRVTKRRPSMSILDLLEGELRTVVAGAVQRALKKEGAVRYTGVPMSGGENPRRCVLSAEVFINPRTSSNHVLITLEQEANVERRHWAPIEVQDGSFPAAHASQERLDTLEGELSYTRETLQSTIEELQTSNEELQATNEELVASNEELQSTNEELHSVNEELYTVNAELQRKIAELRELNSDMQHFLESTDSGTLFLDKYLCIRRYTPRIAGVFHIQPQDMGRSIRDFSHNLTRTSIREDIDRVLEKGEVLEDEVKDREGTTYFLRILPYRPAGAPDSPSTIEGVVLSLTDISALDRARAKLSQLSAIVESSEDGIIGTSLDGVITSWNKGAEKLYGYVHDEVVGRHASLLAPQGFATQIHEYLRSVRSGEKLEHVDVMRVRKDGTPIDVSVTISPVCDGEGHTIGASAIARDVTQLRRAQRDLTEREARIRLLLDSTAEAIFGLNPDGICIFCNSSCARLLGYASANDLIGRRIHPLIHPMGPDGECHPEADCDIYSVLRTGKGTHSDEEVIWRADGKSFLVEYWSYPIQADRRSVGVVVTFIDITERKRAEEEIRTAARRREQFIAMLSHELRNPLAAVIHAARVMRGQHESNLVEKAQKVVERQSGHMARLLDDLLDVSRITRGGIELKKEDVDLRDVIQAAMESMNPVFDERRTVLSVDVADEILPVRGDPARIQQVIVNLLTNAARYSPVESQIHLSASTDGQSVILRVKDEGRGIAPEMLSEVFDLFVQADQGLDRSSGGLGIGLTLVRSIVELHGGKVEARSGGAGTGSEFIVTLPRQLHAVVRQETPVVYIPSPKRRVVVVEDQEDAREMLRVLLESKGHFVVTQADGPSAVEAIEREHPDVALVDIGLPEMSGYDVARALRKNPVLEDIILIALTGYGNEEDIENAHAAGFDEHLTKPADFERIDEILSARRRRAS